jgi:hypothetical protein
VILLAVVVVNADMTHARRRRWPPVLLAALVAISVAAFAGACGGDDLVLLPLGFPQEGYWISNS